MIRSILLILGVLTCLPSQGTKEWQAGQAFVQTETPLKTRRILVVVSTKNPIASLTNAEVARIFLRRMTRWPNRWPITVYERPVKEKIRQSFSKRILNKKPEALFEYWMNIEMTRGVKPPKVLRSAKLVKRYLERVKGGIAYIYEDEVDATVKVIEIKEKP